MTQSFKFIDQTTTVQNAKRRKSTPGTSQFKCFVNDVSKHDANRKRCSKTNAHANTSASTSASSDYSVNYSPVNMAVAFQNEMSDLIRSPISYGIQGLEEDPTDPNFDFFANVNDATLQEFEEQERKNHEKIKNESRKSDSQQLSIKLISEIDQEDDFKVVMHYAIVMTRFQTLKSPEWNVYAYMGTELATKYKPLRHAMLAWSALHLALQENTSTDLAYKYYDESLTTVMRLDVAKSQIPVVYFLTTGFFLLQFDITSGTKHAKAILKHIWSQLRVGQFFGDNGGVEEMKLSPFEYNILSDLLHLDIRSAVFTGNVSFPDYIDTRRKQSNPNIDYLVSSKVYDDKASNIIQKTEGVSSSIYDGYNYPSYFNEEDSLVDHILVMVMKNMMMLGRLIRLRNWLDQCGNSTEFDSNTLKGEIDQLVMANKKLYNVHGGGKMVRFMIYICNALAFSSIILFDRVCYPSIRTTDACQKAASEVLRIAVEIDKMRVARGPGTQLWPFPLLLAGLETTDVVYQEWVMDELKSYNSEKWGLHIGKAVTLYAECIHRQSLQDTRIDVAEVMEATTGNFIL